MKDQKLNALMEISSIHLQMTQLGNKFGEQITPRINEEKTLAILSGHINDDEQIAEHISELKQRLDHLWGIVEE